MPTPDVRHLTNPEIINTIDLYVHNELHRLILKRKLVDGISYERLAEEVHYSPCYVKRIAYQYTDLFRR